MKKTIITFKDVNTEKEIQCIIETDLEKEKLDLQIYFGECGVKGHKEGDYINFLELFIDALKNT